MRIAQPADIPALTGLWERCFGDPPEAVQEFFTSLWEEITVFQTGDGTAMLTAMPVTWQGRQAAYLYAVGTHPDHRGKGLCRELMSFAEAAMKERGCSYTILSPAEEPLFRFYEKLGYQTCFYAEYREYKAELCKISAESISAAKYGALRERLAPEGVQYPEPILRMQEGFGMLLRVGADGCASVERHGEGFLVRELLAKDEAAAAAAVCRYCGVSSLRCKLPGNDPYGMAKSLDGSPLSASWLGLAFE